MAKKRMARKSNSHTFPIIVSLIVFFAIFLTLYTLMKNNTDLRSRADTSNGVGQSVREEMSPAVRVSAPAANASVSNPVTVSAFVPQDMTVERVQFFVDTEKVPFSEVFEAPFEATLATSFGRHRVYIMVYDTEGNVKRSQEVSFTVN